MVKCIVLKTLSNVTVIRLPVMIQKSIVRTIFPIAGTTQLPVVMVQILVYLKEKMEIVRLYIYRGGSHPRINSRD
jgi:hypothetical protein